MFKRSGAGNYAYTSARSKAKKSKLLKAEDYNKLLAMSVPEISRYIGELGYSKEITDMADRHEGLELLEYATYANMAKAFRSILGAATGDCKNMIGGYLKKWVYTNALTILRGKKYGLSVDQIHMDLVPIGYMSHDEVERMIGMSTVEESINAFCSSVHIRIPDEIMGIYKTQGDLAPVEDYFTKAYYRDLLSAVEANDRPTTVFRNFVRSLIDIKNVETLLKFKIESIDVETVMGFYIPGGREIDERIMSQLAASPDVASLLNDMQQLKMYADIKDSLSADTTVTGVISVLAHYEGQLANAVASLYPLSVLPAVDYILHKEQEVRNLRLIAYGVETGLDNATVKDLLVI